MNYQQQSPRLKGISISGFKSIQELQELELRPLNVLIGPNGGGKTNFIDLFRLLASIAQSRLQIFVAKHDGPDGLLTCGRKHTDVIDVKFKFGVICYRFSLVPAANHLVFEREEISKLQLSTLLDLAGPVNQSILQQSPLPRHIVSTGSGHFESNLANPDLETDDNLLGTTWDAINSISTYQFHDTSETASVRNAQSTRDNYFLKKDASNLGPVLRKLHDFHTVEYNQIVDSIRTVAPFFGSFYFRDTPNDRFDLEWFHRDDPSTVLGPRQLSDGTIRFICLATLLLQPAQLQPAVILIDEPELGLHPLAITVVSEMLRHASDERQVIVATQSADLISELEPDDIVVVDRTSCGSTFTRLNQNDLRVWIEDYTLGELWKGNFFGGRP